ncbi:MAG: chemotaxis response regulator protein-glutamate methylesterase [Candidatus Methylomirabilales bacterium]
MSTPSYPIRVLVVDDSALMRKLIPTLLARDPQIEVVGTAMDGVFALRKIPELLPDVVTLDIDMPRMDGLTTLRRIMEESPRPVILLSSHTQQGAALTVLALEMGAVDFIAKPRGPFPQSLEEVGAELIAKVRAAASAIPQRIHRVPEEALFPKVPPTQQSAASRVVAIGISTGGPYALASFLPVLAEDFPAAILIVQHMPAGFTRMLAERLNHISRVRIKEAEDGDPILPGRVLIAPGNLHLKVRQGPAGPVAAIEDGIDVNGHRPSADVLFRSVAEVFGRRAMGVIMTGMGHDGVEGLGQIRRAGGTTFGQDEASCVIYGMPKVAVERGFVQHVVPVEKLARSLQEQLEGLERGGDPYGGYVRIGG